MASVSLAWTSCLACKEMEVELSCFMDVSDQIRIILLLLAALPLQSFRRGYWRERWAAAVPAHSQQARRESES